VSEAAPTRSAAAVRHGLSSALTPSCRLNVHLAAWSQSVLGKDAESSISASVIPPPRDMDPRLLAWKGMAVLARLESVGEMWLQRRDWDAFGWRALREKR